MSHNDITGEKIATKAVTEAYRDGHERIFGKREAVNAVALDRPVGGPEFQRKPVVEGETGGGAVAPNEERKQNERT